MTRLGEAGATELEIAGITGHSLVNVHQILEHYFVRTAKVARELDAKRHSQGKERPQFAAVAGIYPL